MVLPKPNEDHWVLCLFSGHRQGQIQQLILHLYHRTSRNPTEVEGSRISVRFIFHALAYKCLTDKPRIASLSHSLGPTGVTSSMELTSVKSSGRERR